MRPVKICLLTAFGHARGVSGEKAAEKPLHLTWVVRGIPVLNPVVKRREEMSDACVVELWIPQLHGSGGVGEPRGMRGHSHSVRGQQEHSGAPTARWPRGPQAVAGESG